MKNPKGLVELIAELKTPKGRKNSFAKFNYRNVEDIMERVKPLLLKHNLLLNMSDSISEFQERLFVKATAVISDGDCVMQSTGFAELDSARKGMSMEQISGSASSYARKYALAGLLCLDASEDSDSHNGRHERCVESLPQNGLDKITRTQASKIKRLLKETNSDESRFLDWLKADKIEEIRLVDFARAKKALEAKVETVIEPLK